MQNLNYIPVENNSRSVEISRFFFRCIFFLSDLKITSVAMSLDNFAYVITDQKTTVIIDPGDPEPVCVSIE